MKLIRKLITHWLMVLALAGVLGLASVSASTITWTNLAGGNWSNPGNWDLGTVPGLGDTANITLAGNYTVTMDADVTVSNLTAGAASGTQTLNWNAANLVVGNFTINSNASFNLGSNSVLNLSGMINNQGTIQWGTGYLYVGANPAGLNNDGLVILSGWLDFAQSSTSFPIGSFNNNGTILVTNQSTFFISGGWTFTNSGAIDVQSGVTLDMESIPSNSVTFADGTVINVAGTGQMLFAPLVQWELTQSELTANGTITVNGPSNNSGSFVLGQNAILKGTQTWTGTGSLNWAGGPMTQSGTTQIATNFVLYITDSGGQSLTQNHSLNNQGTVMWNTSTPIGMSGQASFINSGLIVMQTNCALQQSTADCAFNNQSGGIVRIVGGNSWVNCPFTNSGTLDLELGTLTVSNAYALGPSSVSRFAAGGPATSLAVPALNPAGTLSVILTNGYTPTNGSQFTLMNYGSHNGTFASFQAPTLPAGLQWQLDYGANSLILEAITTPTQISSPMILSNGTFQFTLSGPPANSYLIQTSSNLVDWVTLETNGIFSGTATITDPAATNFGRRFYRGVIGD